jgi:ADP-ribosyl-[dinitrogen reductase] hydrolase
MNPTAAISRKHRILGGLWGAVVGDALGVPVEFKTRVEIQANPVTDMRGDGTHHQPAGTWSDDGALLLCTVDSLVNFEFDTEDLGRRFVAWYENGLWAARGEVFDVGLTTADALIRIRNGIPAEQAGGRDGHSNGNGSIMRILPVALRFAGEPIKTLLDRTRRASAVTHGHERSQMACGYYALVARHLLEGAQPKQAAEGAGEIFAQTFAGTEELPRFRHLLSRDLSTILENLVASSGYVIDTLTASLWCLSTTDNYRECVLKAVNLGGDTDTTGCVAGGLAGVRYGVNAIPQNWIQELARQQDLESLFNRFSEMNDISA